MSQENQSQETQETTGQTSEDFQTKYRNEVDQSKKYRERAQTAETKLQELETVAEAARKADLEKRGEFETLAKELKTKLEKAQARADAFDEFESTRRTALLDKLPDDRKKFAESMSLENLEEFVTLETAQATPSNEGRPTQRKPSTEHKGYHEMTPAEREKNWDAYVGQFKK